jgi:flagellar hook-length control protein FliK
MPAPAEGAPAALPQQSGRGPQVPIEVLGRTLPQQVMDLLAAGRAPAAAPPAGAPAASGTPTAAPVLEVRQPPSIPTPPGPAPLPPVTADAGADPAPSLPPQAAAVAEAAIALEASYGPSADRAAPVVAAAKSQRPDGVPDGPATPPPAAARASEAQNLLAEAVRASAPTDGSGLRHDPAAARDSLPPVTLPTLAATPPTPAAAQPAAQLQVNTPVGSDGWAQSLGDRVVTLTERDVSHAQLKLNPPQLGPLEVRVQVNGDQASVSFTTHSNVTREALEQAAPRLREMLGSQGFASVNVSVSQHSFSERPQQPMRYEPLPSWAEAIATPAASQAAAASRVARSLLDAYA